MVANKNVWAISSLIVGALLINSDGEAQPVPSKAPGMLSVADFLPKGHVTDGSVSYQAEIQKAIDSAAREGRTLVFPAMTYRLDESGLKLASRLTLWMYGAVFRFDEHRQRDGQAFHGHDVSDLQLLGGEIVGRNDAWADGVNIRGVYLTGQSRNIRIRDMHLHDLSSNGIGIFGTDKQLSRDVWVTDVIIENCCNRYGDYLSDKPGPEKGSTRDDQGLIAFYHVQDFVVRGCRFEKSRSDGTHFYKCRQGQFVHNRVYSAQMGGYFVETSDDILAADNVIRDNGSRGVTIERGSKNCTLQGNVVVYSGREGLWAPDCVGLVVTGNSFLRNGRKPNGKKPTQIWNVNITINEDPGDPSKSPTQDYLIANNIIDTGDSQIAAIRIDANDTTSGIVVRDNLLRGNNRQVLLEGVNRDKVTLQRNE